MAMKAVSHHRTAATRKRRLPGGLLAAIVATGAAGSAARAQVVVPPAVSTALGAAYGRYDPARRCWFANAPNGARSTTGCIAVTRADAVHTPGGGAMAEPG